MKSGYACITSILGGVLALQLGSAGLRIDNPAFWLIFGTALALGGVFYKWGDDV